MVSPRLPRILPTNAFGQSKVTRALSALRCAVLKAAAAIGIEGASTLPLSSSSWEHSECDADSFVVAILAVSACLVVPLLPLDAYMEDGAKEQATRMWRSIVRRPHLSLPTHRSTLVPSGPFSPITFERFKRADGEYTRREG